MREVHFYVKYGPGDTVNVIGPNYEIIQLYPGSEAHLKFNYYEKEKKKK